MSNKKAKILFYDVETTPLQAWVWRCGQQWVRHPQLVEGFTDYDVICIAYEWLDSPKRHVLDWGYKAQNSSKMIEKFGEVCEEADMIIGKNNKRFDDKIVNTLRLYHGLEGKPHLMEKVDDLESQMRKHFYLPSYGLDYFSEQLGYGGKDKMEFADWTNIVNKVPTDGMKSFKKMKTYCQKDVNDTKEIWKHCVSHMKPKYNYSAYSGEAVCKVCGSSELRRNGYYVSAAGVRYIQFYCKAHNGYAGKIAETARNHIIK